MSTRTQADIDAWERATVIDGLPSIANHEDAAYQPLNAIVFVDARGRINVLLRGDCDGWIGIVGDDDKVLFDAAPFAGG